MTGSATVTRSWAPIRIVVILAASAAVVAALARPPLPHGARLLVLSIVAAVAAWSARSALLLLGARKGRLVVATDAPTHRLTFATVPIAVGALALGAAMAYAPVPDEVAIVVTGALAAVSGAFASHVRDTRAKGPRATSRAAWLLLDTALPAGLIAACVSVAVGTARLHALATIPATEIARHLAATTFAYAVFLGLGGFLKAYGEQSAGLVVVAKSTRSVPGPIVCGGVLGVALLFIGPRVLPALPLADVLLLKACAGVAVGGTLSLLGALQGARAASLGLRRA